MNNETHMNDRMTAKDFFDQGYEMKPNGAWLSLYPAGWTPPPPKTPEQLAEKEALQNECKRRDAIYDSLKPGMQIKVMIEGIETIGRIQDIYGRGVYCPILSDLRHGDNGCFRWFDVDDILEILPD